MKAKRRAIYVVINLSAINGQRIPRDSNPTFLHPSIGEAKAEAQRLSLLHAGKQFGVFRAVGLFRTEPLKANWSQEMPEIADESDIPF